MVESGSSSATSAFAEARGRSRASPFVVAAWLVACACPGAAAYGQQAAPAETQRPILFTVGSAITWDDNVFRLPDSADPQAVLGESTKADRYASVSVGLHIDKPYSQQRIRFNASETAFRYQTFSFLDSNVFQYDGAWDWHVTPRVSGTLSADRSQALANYGDYRSPVRNLVTTQNRNFSVDGWLFGGWHLLAGVSQNEVKNSVVFVQQASYRSNGANVGVKYVAESGNSVTFIRRSSRADYIDQLIDPVNLLDDGYRRDDSDLLAEWRLSGKSILNGRLTWTDYRTNNFAQRDFTGAGGSLGYQWQPTGKLSFNFSAGRTLGVYVDNFSSYVATDTVSFSPSWQLSARTGLRASLTHAVSDYRGAVVALAAPARRDTLNTAQLAVEWAPLRVLTLSASVQHERRTSNTAGFDYDDTTARLNASLAF